MILQLNPPLPLFTPKGKGIAHFVIDYGIEHHLQWVVALEAGGECWTFSNPNIRFEWNQSLGRVASK